MARSTNPGDGARSPARLLVSVTSLDLLDLRRDVSRLIDAGVDGLHLDVCDGRFVPFITFGVQVCRAVRGITDAHLDVHLMVEDPEPLVRALGEIGNLRVTFHLEATRYPWRVVSLARELGLKVGIAANPITPVETLAPLADVVDCLHLLLADHDFAGDRPLPHMVERIRRLRQLTPAPVCIEIDGGVEPENAGAFVMAGADDVVAGRAVCAQVDWAGAVRTMRQAMSNAWGNGARSS